MALTLSTGAFSEGGRIPGKFTCQGENISPPLTWSGAPAGTAGFAIILEDQDAPHGIFTHWIIFNIPANINSLAEGVSPRGQPPGRSYEGKNDMGTIGYSGPCPPPGKLHRYYLKLYALKEMLDLEPGIGRSQLLNAIKDNKLEETQSMATYQRV